MRLLIVEDEENLREILKKRLKGEHYSVDSCGDGIEAMEYMDMVEYDGIILDIMLPGKDGLEILKEIRERGNQTPVLMLTARDAIEDRVKGLDLGADDYMVKPFAFAGTCGQNTSYDAQKAAVYNKQDVFENLVLDRDMKKVWRDEREIILSGKEFMILEYLMRNPNIVLSRKQIEENVWDYDFEGGSNVVDVYIRYLRKKIDDGFEQKFIHTVRGLGYVLRKDD